MPTNEPPVIIIDGIKLRVPEDHPLFKRRIFCGNGVNYPIGEAWAFNNYALGYHHGDFKTNEFAAYVAFTYWMLKADLTAAGGDLIAMCDTDEYLWAMDWIKLNEL